MSFARKYIGDLFIPLRFFIVAGSCAVLFIISFFIEVLLPVAKSLSGLVFFLAMADYVLLFILGRSPLVQRLLSDRLSNGDENAIRLKISNRMFFPVNIDIIDELPEQFQVRDFVLKSFLNASQVSEISYTVRPIQRGAYSFGHVLCFVRSALGLVIRRFKTETPRDVAVYPSYTELRKYQLAGDTVLVSETGNRRVRKVGQSMEFEQIKEYISGDDIRNINWKATARKGLHMINHYSEEKSQQVYCIIDKGRLMKMPFEGLTLLDYAINSTLVMTSVCLQKQDKIGLFTFAEKMGTVLAADKKPVQRESILKALYKQQTAFLESDFEMLYMQIRNKIRQRSLLILYTNFESLNGLKRQINYLRSIARHHLLLVVFFENTELSRLSRATALNVEDVYIKTIAEKFIFEKKLIVKELLKYGILSLLTTPQNLTINSVNKYLELKMKQAL